jgi:hypothetical protein
VYIIYQLNIDAKYAVCAVVAVFTLVLPAVSTVMLLKMDGIKSLKMNSQEERKLPFIMSAIFYATAYFSMQQVGIPKLITNAILGATISLVILFLANFKQKTSAHMVGIGGLLGIVYTLSEIYIVGISQFLFPSIILAGLIGYSRLKLKAHQSIEIYSGLIIGFFSEYLIL